MTDGPRLLLVEDDRTLRELLEELFVSEGFMVDTAADGQRALHKSLITTYDVCVLDRGLPAIEGVDLLTRLRARGVATPTLILSARDSPVDRVDGLDAGAEDYLGKPFDVTELLARVHALLRRGRDAAVVALPSGARFDVPNGVVHIDDTDITLSPREADILAVLARSPRQVFSRADILIGAFPDADDEGLVDTYVHHLRRKLGREIVATVRGVGYRLGSG